MLVLNSEYFREELEFTPRDDSVDDGMCFQGRITFREYEARMETEGEIYSEWMIRCKPTRYYANFQFEFYLSQAYAPGQVFVYRWETKTEICIENLFTDVRFRSA